MQQTVAWKKGGAVNGAWLQELNYPNVTSNGPTSSVQSFQKALKTVLSLISAIITDSCIANAVY